MAYSPIPKLRLLFVTSTAIEEQLNMYADDLELQLDNYAWHEGLFTGSSSSLHCLEIVIAGTVVNFFFPEKDLINYLDPEERERINESLYDALEELKETLPGNKENSLANDEVSFNKFSTVKHRVRSERRTWHRNTRH